MSTWNQYTQGMRLGMDQRRNALSQNVEKEKRDRIEELRNILSGAYQPATPEIPEAPTVGITAPGQDPIMHQAIPARPEGIDYGALYEAGFGPEALGMQQKIMTATGTAPSGVKEYKYFKSLPDDKARAEYLAVKRAQQFLDTGSRFVAPSQLDPTVTQPVADKELSPSQEIEYIQNAARERAASTAIGSAQGAAESELRDVEATLPRLKEVVATLSELGHRATYTYAGQGADFIARQSGMGIPESAVARREYMSVVDNEILPLLKQTFGAAFTVQEGESLRATLGDPNASPEEKDAVLKSFIGSKIANLETKRRRVGKGTGGKNVGDIIPGPDGRKYIIRTLKADGTPDDVELAK